MLPARAIPSSVLIAAVHARLAACASASPRSYCGAYIHVTNLFAGSVRGAHRPQAKHFYPPDIHSEKQTFYIFFGVAIAVGVIFGVVLHLIERSSVHLFGLDRPAPPRERAVRGHSASSYRAARETKRLDEELRNVARSRPYTTEPVLGQGGKERDTRRPQMSPLSPPHARQRAGLLSTTILEEVDDSEDYGCD